MSVYSTSTPILFIIFNRPETALRSFQEIKKVKPKHLYIAADGPRDEAEKLLCDQTRELILQSIDWECDVQQLFSDSNLGCGIRVYTAIDWVFSHHEKAIILEDDCVANNSFFSFCDALLKHYEDDQRVMHISGNNFQTQSAQDEASYYFSKYPHAWGWATWKRAWMHFDWTAAQLESFRAQNGFQAYCVDNYETQHWSDIFNSVHGGKDDIWDYQWVLACWFQNAVSIVPNRNLVSNIGFGEDATHTKERNQFLEKDTYNMPALVHPKGMILNAQADLYTFDHNFGGKILKRKPRFRSRLKRFVLHRITQILGLVFSQRNPNSK